MSVSPLLPSTPLTASSSGLTSDAASASATDAHAPAARADLRPNEHLAVMIDRALWKPDAATVRCDTISCRRKFGLFERRHHCRKCGGVFCQTCSARETALLDTSALDLAVLPKHISIRAYECATVPVQTARVCDGCFDAIHGRAPVWPPSSPVHSARPVRIQSVSASSSLCSSLATPPDASGVLSPLSVPTLCAPRAKRTRTGSATSRASGANSPRPRSTLLPRGGPRPLAEVAPELAALSYGELDAYPLRLPSAVCKATGGGLWTPKTPPRDYVVGKPGSKDFLVVQYEDEESVAERRRRANPIIRHGDIKYRFPAPPEPPRAPMRFPVATF